MWILLKLTMDRNMIEFRYQEGICFQEKADTFFGCDEPKSVPARAGIRRAAVIGRQCREDGGGIMTLEEFFAQVPKAAVAFSGGTDSAFLLWLAREYGCDVRAYYVKTVFQPESELEDARRITEELGIPLTVVEKDILSVREAAANGSDRCYHCKRVLFAGLWEAARQDGYEILMDGTNASDDAGDRPGMRALKELQVRSPLRECGITKREVRERSRKAGLFTWEKPAYACLATRIPTGTAIATENLRKVEQAEQALLALGFRDFRVRMYGNGARIQVREEQMPLVLEQRGAVTEALKRFFSEVFLDLETRKENG